MNKDITITARTESVTPPKSPRSRGKGRRRIRYSLAFGITLAIVGASLGSAMFMHVAWRVFVERSTSGLSERINEEIFASVRNEVITLFQDVLRVQGTLHSLLRSNLADPRINEDIEALYLNTAIAHKDFSWISYGRTNGDFLGVQRLISGNLQWNYSAYDETARNATRITEEYRVRDRVLTLVGTDRLVNTYYSPQRPWFDNAIATETPQDVWTDVYVFSSNRVPGINSSIALRDAVTNEVIGVVSIAINLGRLSDYLADIKVSESGVLFITNAQREIIAYHDPSEVVAAHPNNTQLTLRSLGASNDVRLRIANEAIENSNISLDSRSSAQFSTTFDSLEDGKEYAVFLEPLSDLENTDLKLSDLGWYLGITVPTVDILGTIEQSARRLLLITYTLIALIIIVVFVFVRARLIRPIRQIADQAEHIRRFELDMVELPDSALSEINLLTQSIKRINNGLTSFKKYVPTELVQLLIEKGLEAKLGGTERNITIFFSDIAGFTYISEVMRKDIIGHLDSYFTNLSAIIGEHEGTIDKYIGDAIMAFWGAPVPQADHALRACNAALRCAQTLQQLRVDWKSRGKEPIFVRFGLNSGKVLVGNFGSHVRMSYTAIGDPVNVASRLEGLNKVYGTEIIIGQPTYEQVSRNFVTRKLDRVAVYGRAESIEIYELIAVKGADYHPDHYQWIDIFEEGLVLYRQQQWKGAVRCFLKAHKQRRGEDNASLLFIKRCQHLANRSVPADWSGTFVLQTK